MLLKPFQEEVEVPVFCHWCGDSLETDARYCGECGTRQDAATVAPTTSQRPASVDSTSVIAPVPQLPVSTPLQAGDPTRPSLRATASAEDSGTLWLRRVGASTIDVLVAWLPAVIVSYVLLFVALLSGPDTSPVGIGGVLLAGLLPTFVYAGYVTILMSRVGDHNGQTWGKQALGIRVTRHGGGAMTAGSVLVREVVVKLILIWSMLGTFLLFIPVLIDGLWPLWDRENEALHDKMCSTWVIRA